MGLWLQLAPGYFADSGGAVATCPANSYCPGGGAPVPCPPNTISPAAATALTDCLPGPGSWGLAGSPATLCRANYFCPAGATAETACLANTQSPGTFSHTIMIVIAEESLYNRPLPPYTSSFDYSIHARMLVINEGLTLIWVKLSFISLNLQAIFMSMPVLCNIAQT